MYKVRIYNGNDSVDIELLPEQYKTLLNFITRQDNMQIFLIK